MCFEHEHGFGWWQFALYCLYALCCCQCNQNHATNAVHRHLDGKKKRKSLCFEKALTSFLQQQYLEYIQVFIWIYSRDLSCFPTHLSCFLFGCYNRCSVEFGCVCWLNQQFAPFWRGCDSDVFALELIHWKLHWKSLKVSWKH